MDLNRMIQRLRAEIENVKKQVWQQLSSFVHFSQFLGVTASGASALQLFLMEAGLFGMPQDPAGGRAAILASIANLTIAVLV